MKKLELYRISTPEFDYNCLLDLLSEYKHPRDKISELLRKKEIVRVKKGLYVLGPRYDRPFSLPILANLIYGPSYISKEFALSFYGLIPERVNTVTSVCLKKSRAFVTPVGRFTYEKLPDNYFSTGYVVERLDSRRSFLIATPEKALIDRIRRERGVKTLEDIKHLLLEGLRIDPDGLQQLSADRLRRLATRIDIPIVRLLCRFVKGIR